MEIMSRGEPRDTTCAVAAKVGCNTVKITRRGNDECGTWKCLVEL